MRRQAHLTITFIVSILAVWIGLNFSLFNSWLTSSPLIIVALFSTILPDILEPAKNRRHRKFLHSRRMFSFLTFGMLISLILILTGRSSYYFYILFAFLGYWLHLAADMTTSRLPRQNYRLLVVLLRVVLLFAVLFLATLRLFPTPFFPTPLVVAVPFFWLF